MLVKIYNKQQYAVVRGGHIFPPKAETEVEVRDDKKLAEIKACVYLKVMIPEVSSDETPEDEVELTLEQALDTKTKAELLAEFSELELNPRDKKADIVAAIVAALNESDGGEIVGLTNEIPPYSEWADVELRNLAADWDLELPAEIEHGDLVTLIEAEHDRRYAELLEWAADWEIDVPEGAHLNVLVALIEPEAERRKALETGTAA